MFKEFNDDFVHTLTNYVDKNKVIRAGDESRSVMNKLTAPINKLLPYPLIFNKNDFTELRDVSKLILSAQLYRSSNISRVVNSFSGAKTFWALVLDKSEKDTIISKR